MKRERTRMIRIEGKAAQVSRRTKELAKRFGNQSLKEVKRQLTIDWLYKNTN